MSWINDAKLSTKLITAFALCALITLAVGLLGNRGVSQLSENLNRVFNNNLVSVLNTDQAKIKAVGQTRDMYRLYVATQAGLPQSVKDEFIASMNANQAASEKAFSTYRRTLLADDERAAGDQMEKDWPAYQAIVQRYVALMKAGDVENGRALLLGDLQKAYRGVMDELTIMTDSNNRQVNEGAVAATELASSAKTSLYTGIGLAFVAAILLGLFISRMISKPIAYAVSSAKSIAGGDLTVEVIHTPGHTPACVSYRIGDAVFTGDTLFMPDYGTARTDFPGGDARTLYRSIQRLLTLPGETRVFVGHDYLPQGRTDYRFETTVAEQRAHNIHIGGGVSEDAFVALGALCVCAQWW